MKLSRSNMEKMNANMYADFSLPEKILQFGDSPLLRGTIDWMVHCMNKTDHFKGRIVTAGSDSSGDIQKACEQDGLYTLLTRECSSMGTIQKTEIISSISRQIDPAVDFPSLLENASNPELRVIVSDTGARGITFNPSDKPGDCPPSTFPAMVTLLLRRRFQAFNGDLSKGFIFLPCESVLKNGQLLQKVIMEYCSAWGYEERFVNWVKEANVFLSAMVDRIVIRTQTGEFIPQINEHEYDDACMYSAESYNLVVIEGDSSFAIDIPLTESGCNVIWTESLLPYWKRKQRILKGAYAVSMFPAALSGKKTVRECMEDKALRKFILNGIYKEVIPSMSMPETELRMYASSVFDRFENPFISGNLSCIPPFSITMFGKSIVPSIAEYMGRKGRIPEVLCMSFAALIACTKTRKLHSDTLFGDRNKQELVIVDDPEVLTFFRSVWDGYDGSDESQKSVCMKILSNRRLWGMDLSKHTDLVQTINRTLASILKQGMHETFMIKEGIPA